MTTNKKFAESLGNNLWSIFLPLLKTKFVEAGLKVIFGSAMKVAGFKLWITKFLLEHFADEIIIPGMEALLVEGKYIVHVKQGKHYIAKLKQAETVEQHNDAVDDILS